LPDGDPQQTVAAVHVMRQLAIAGEMSPLVREQAAFIVAGLGRDQLTMAGAIAGWVEQHTRFLYDPLHFEAFTPADQTIAIIDARGLAQMDCDDVAILTAALGLSVGLRARFVVVSFYAPDAPYEHVWAELSDSAGLSWVPSDPSRPVLGLPPLGRPPLIIEV
jgi:transglutaminase-like putative cysteine protease